MCSINSLNDSVGSRLTALWNDILFCQQPTNISELWKEHLKIRQDFVSLKLSDTSKWERTTDRLKKLPIFLKWAKKMGIEYEDVDVLLCSNGLSLATNKSRCDGEIAISVPHTALLSVDNSIKIETLKKILDNDEMLNAMENVALAMTVAHEFLRKEESEWAPYIDILPVDFQTPIFYTAEEFQLLKPSPVFETALLMYRQIARQFVYFYLRILGDIGEKGKKHLTHSNCSHPFIGSPFSPQNFTFDLYRWCVSIVSTRINVVPSQYKLNEDGTPKMIPALIPFIDFANHAHNSTKHGSVFFCSESNCIKLQVNNNFMPNEELCIFYGKRTNTKFLLHNGFVPKLPNPDDFYELKIGLPASALNFKAKVDCLKRKNIFPNIQQQQSSIYLFQLSPEPTELIIKQSPLWNFALIFVSNSLDELNDHSKLISSEHEQKASKFLADRFRILLRGYGDVDIAFKENENEIKQTILCLKKCELRLLADYQKLIERDLLVLG